MPPDAAYGCDLCNADLPKRPRTARDSVEQVTGRIRARALAIGDRTGERLSEIGDRLVGGLGDLPLDAVDRGLQSLQRRLGLSGVCGKRYAGETLPGGDHTNQAAARCVSNATQRPDSPHSDGTPRRA